MTNAVQFSVDEATRYLRAKDAALSDLIDRVGPFSVQLRTDDPYASLLRTILFQQVAGAAANAIQKRFLALYGEEEKPPTPEQVLDTADEDFRAAGVSRQKAAYMRDLAVHVVDGKLNFSQFPSLADDEVTQRLVAVKGIGQWSADMYLMFHLGRPDILPVGDLGVRNGMRITYALEATPTPAQAHEIGAAWAPYRSVGSWYMWRAGEPTAPDI